MNNELIIPSWSLEDIADRLARCQALLDAVRVIQDVRAVSSEALGGVSDLLEVIRRDFRADIDCAEIYTEKAAGGS